MTGETKIARKLSQSEILGGRMMIELICKALTYMIEVIMVILIAGIPVVIGIAALVTLWRWLGI